MQKQPFNVDRWFRMLLRMIHLLLRRMVTFFKPPNLLLVCILVYHPPRVMNHAGHAQRGVLRGLHDQRVRGRVHVGEICACVHRSYTKRVHLTHPPYALHYLLVIFYLLS